MRYRSLFENFSISRMVVWICVVFFSIVVIVFGSQWASKGLVLFGSESSTVKAKVLSILSNETIEEYHGEGDAYTFTTITFLCEIQSGERSGEQITAQQQLDSLYAETEFTKAVEEGDTILLIPGMDTEGNDVLIFSDYYRIDKVLWLGAAFLILVLVFGRWKGVNTLLSLIFTFMYVFLIFVPAVMNGYNIYLNSTITCVFSIVVTFLLVSGPDKKTLAAISGCIFGTIVAALLTLLMSRVLMLTGFVDEHSMYLTMLETEQPIDLTAIIFAAIIIGAMGAIMDVAMDIASSLYEISRHVPDISFKELSKSGMRIGRDLMGTMANTLVLAYVGSSLCSFMILLAYAGSLLQLLNREAIIVEIMQAVIGSLAILLTVPLTVVICGVLYLRHRHSNVPKGQCKKQETENLDELMEKAALWEEYIDDETIQGGSLAPRRKRHE